MEKPPSSLKRRGSRRGTSTSSRSKTVSFSDQQTPPRSVLIVVANGSESIDVMDCSKILSLFGMKVSLAAASRKSPVELQGGVQILADYTFEQATEHQRWSVMLLPGGMAAVYELIQDRHFLALIEKHVQQRGIIAAAGASATCLLPELGHVDKHGPTCMPSSITEIVTKESEYVWTTPGLNTTAHLALALGEELYGTPRAQQVAASLSLPPLSFDDLAKMNNETRAGEESSVEQGGTDESNDDAISDNTTLGVKNALFSPVSTSQAFSLKVWKTLRDLGWTRKQKDGLNYFFRPGIKQESEGSPRVDWFISYDGVVKYLESHADPKFRALADGYHNAIAAFREPETGPTQEPEAAPRLDKERKVECVDHVESTKATETESFVDRLFDHVAWPRLQDLGWKRRKRKPTPDSSHAYRYRPPGGRGSHLNSPDRVVQFLMRDGYWRSKTASLRIVDLFRSCQRIRQEMTSNADSPECVEQETKLRMPALTSY